jgi:hypothetical protein
VADAPAHSSGTDVMRVDRFTIELYRLTRP